MLDLAGRMLEFRKREGLTQAQAAELAGFPSNSWARFERGDQVPRMLHAAAIERLISAKATD